HAGVLGELLDVLLTRAAVLDRVEHPAQHLRGVDQALAGALGDGLAHRRDADAQAGGQFGVLDQGAGWQLPGDDLVTELLDDGGCAGRRHRVGHTGSLPTVMGGSGLYPWSRSTVMLNPWPTP